MSDEDDSDILSMYDLLRELVSQISGNPERRARFLRTIQRAEDINLFGLMAERMKEGAKPNV